MAEAGTYHHPNNVRTCLTCLYLQATAGLRLLPEDQAEAIINSVKTELKSSGKYFDKALPWIIRDKTLADELMYIPNDDTQMMIIISR